MSHDLKSNLVVASNIWINAEYPPQTNVWQAKQQIPGDLMIDFIARANPHANPRDHRLFETEMTTAQMEEYRNRRFFLNQGEVGAAFDPS